MYAVLCAGWLGIFFDRLFSYLFRDGVSILIDTWQNTPCIY